MRNTSKSYCTEGVGSLGATATDVSGSSLLVAGTSFQIPSALLGDPPSFQCPLCPYSSNRKDNLKTHVRRHTGERPYPCPACDKRFTCRTGLNEHVMTHGKSVLTCALCQHTAKTVAALSAHTLYCPGLPSDSGGNDAAATYLQPWT